MGIMVMGDLPEPRPTFILDRGLYSAPTEQVYPNVPEDEYHAWTAWGSTLIRNVAEGLPLLAVREKFATNTPETGAQRLGSMIHQAILEPDTFDAGRYVEIERVCHRSAKGAAFTEATDAEGWAWAQEQVDDDKTAIPAGWLAKIEEARRAAQRNEATADWLAATPRECREVSVVWHEYAGKLGERFVCKARIDAATGLLHDGDGWALSPNAVVRNLKTTREETSEGFARHAVNSGLHIQMHHERRALYVATGQAAKAQGSRVLPRCSWCVLWKAYGCVSNLDLPEDPWLVRGQNAWIAAVGRIARAIRDDEWPMVADDAEFMPPPWFK